MGFTYAATLNDLLANSDIVSVHCPSTAETKNFINKDFLSHMKPDAVLINTSRGNMWVEDDIIAKLEECKGFWVGTDVFANEPTGKDDNF